MEQYIQGQSRDLVDQAYTKFVSTSIMYSSGICLSSILVFYKETKLKCETREINTHLVDKQK